MSDAEILAWGAAVTDAELALFFLVANALHNEAGLSEPLDERGFAVRDHPGVLREIKPSIDRIRELREQLGDPRAVYEAAVAEAQREYRSKRLN